MKRVTGSRDGWFKALLIAFVLFAQSLSYAHEFAHNGMPENGVCATCALHAEHDSGITEYFSPYVSQNIIHRFGSGLINAPAKPLLLAYNGRAPPLTSK